MQSSLLIILAWAPFPCSTGAQFASNSLILALTKANVAVDLLILYYWDKHPPNQQEIIKKLGVRSVKIWKPQPRFTFRGFIKQLVYRTTQSITVFENPDKKAFVNHFINKNAHQWQAVMLDGILPAIICANNGKYEKQSYFPPLFYRAHNVETHFLLRATKHFKSPIKKIKFIIQAHLMHKIELSLLNAASHVFPISSHDEKEFHDQFKIKHTTCLPVPIHFHHVNSSAVPTDKIELLFVGGLHWPPNRLGLQWFLQKIWPKVSTKRQDVNLKIVGAMDSRLHKKFQHLKRITWLGYVEDLKGLYETCSATIVPIFYGSGTRIKVLESAKFSRTCISTLLGVEGSGLKAGESYLLAQNTEEWIKILLNTEPSQFQVLGEKAYQTIKNDYQPTKLVKRITDVLEALKSE